METITFQNIVLEGITVNKLLNVYIEHTVNQHGYATIEAYMDEKLAMEYEARVDEKFDVRIGTSADGQEKCLFWGSFTDIVIAETIDGVMVTISLISKSIDWDIVLESKSFQNTGLYHEDVIRKILGKQADIRLEVSDEPIGEMIIQYNETAWDFCLRVASHLNAPLLTTIAQNQPTVYVGIPNLPCRRVLSHEEMMESSAILETGDGSFSLATSRYVFVGDEIVYRNITQTVYSIRTDMSTGILVTTIGLRQGDSFAVPIIENAGISGKIFTAQVEGVDKDTVKVHFIDIDAEYDAESTITLPYATAYSSSDGSGFYCMPKKDDYVRVFFPSSDESKAFAASSVSLNSAEEVTYKQWTGPNGKQILLGDDFIKITNDATNSSVCIMMNGDGIEIKSDKNITIQAQNNLTLMSNNKVVISAENDILLNTAESFVDINRESVEIGGANVVFR